MTDRKQDNEGEGNRTAAREYNEATRQFVRSGRVEAAAKDAERALDSPERKDLEAAERQGRSHARGEDPAVGHSR
jgi:hypothetical protein